MILFLLACADMPASHNPAMLCTDPYGFWSGLWHGWIILFSFVGSLFSPEIAMYAPCNTGGWYDFGFWLGVGSTSSSAGRAAATRRKA